MIATVPNILVVGLGNLPYPLTRHSIGQLAIDSLASRLGIRLSAERSGISGHGTVTIGSTVVSLYLFKSKSLMNVSGPSIAAECRKTVHSPRSMIVLSDSLSHKVESLHVRLGGSANGHNGVKSIVSALGNGDFWRFRLGIDRDNTDAATYVMRNLSSHERQFWDGPGLDHLLTEIEKIALNR